MRPLLQSLLHPRARGAHGRLLPPAPPASLRPRALPASPTPPPLARCLPVSIARPPLLRRLSGQLPRGQARLGWAEPGGSPVREAAPPGPTRRRLGPSRPARPGDVSRGRGAGEHREERRLALEILLKSPLEKRLT